MKEIIVLSGKGGAGKTSIAAAFAILAGKKAVSADCDVDAADLHLLLQPDFAYSEKFFSGELAIIDPDRCNSCGECLEICRFDAVEPGDPYRIEPLDCEGCGYCGRICPEEAIRNEIRYVGDFYISKIKTGAYAAHAKLDIGAENSGKLVAKVKSEAAKLAEREGADFVVVDGSPGIGCPVVSSLAGANYVALVAEATQCGFRDMKRVAELVKKFKIKAGCIINKADINSGVTSEIKEFIKNENIIQLAEIPYEEDFSKAMTAGETIPEYGNEKLTSLISQAWENLLKDL